MYVPTLKPLALLVVLTALVLQRSAIAGEIDRLLALPENKIDIGIAALVFAKEVYPDIDVAAYSEQIDLLANKVRWMAKDTHDPEQRIRVLNTVFFRLEGFRYDRDPFSRTKQEYYFLNGILDTRQGTCYTMPLLYLAIAQRLGYPIYPVLAPDHMFLRYVDLSFTAQNIEVTSGGKYFPDDWYAKDFSIPPKARKSGSYLRTLSYREFLGQLLSANAFIFARNGKGQKAITYLEKAIQRVPKFADNYDGLSMAYMAKSSVVSGKLAEQCRKRANQYAQKAKELGFVPQEDIAIEHKTRGG